MAVQHSNIAAGRSSSALKMSAQMMFEVAAGIDVIVVVRAGVFLIWVVLACSRNDCVGNERAVRGRAGINEDGAILHGGRMNGRVRVGLNEGGSAIQR